MQITVVGTGDVGGTLGRRWAEGGHRVVFGSRQPGSETVRNLLETTGGRAVAQPLATCVRQAEVVVLAVPWFAARGTLTALGELAGKVLIDCTNPLSGDLSGLEVGPETSAAEQIQGWAPGARVVKAFSTTGYRNMARPEIKGMVLPDFQCGDDQDAKAVAAMLATELGFEVVDCGPLGIAHQLEQLALLWVHLAHRQRLGRDFAFKLLRR